MRLSHRAAACLLAAPLLGAAGADAQPTQQSCVDVKVGTAQSYSCLNQRLGAVARQAHEGTQTDAPYSATSPSNVTGQFNEDATRERLGTSFGHSVTPQRPPVANPPALPR
jgi:hypothetical protein